MAAKARDVGKGVCKAKLKAGEPKADAAQADAPQADAADPLSESIPPASQPCADPR